jgi:hypothetical protein
LNNDTRDSRQQKAVTVTLLGAKLEKARDKGWTIQTFRLDTRTRESIDMVDGLCRLDGSLSLPADSKVQQRQYQ